MGKTLDELAAETLREGLKERAWQVLPAYGRERGRESGIREDQIVDVIHEWRKERGR